MKHDKTESVVKSIEIIVKLKTDSHRDKFGIKVIKSLMDIV